MYPSKERLEIKSVLSIEDPEVFKTYLTHKTGWWYVAGDQWVLADFENLLIDKRGDQPADRLKPYVLSNRKERLTHFFFIEYLFEHKTEVPSRRFLSWRMVGDDAAPDINYKEGVSVLRRYLDLEEFYYFLRQRDLDFLIFMDESKAVLFYITNKARHLNRKYGTLLEDMDELATEHLLIPRWVRWLFGAKRSDAEVRAGARDSECSVGHLQRIAADIAEKHKKIGDIFRNS